MIHRFWFISALMSSLMVITANAESVNTAMQPQTAANPPISQPPVKNSIHATLSLKQEGQRLYAYVIIEQLQNKNGKIRIDWTPPLHSSCDKSSYILSYQGKKFHTQAYRTLGYGLISGKSITCTGNWRATVKNAQGTLLTTQTIAVESVDAYANNNAKMHALAAIA